MIEHIQLLNESLTAWQAVSGVGAPATGSDVQVVAINDLLVGIPKLYGDARLSLAVVGLFVSAACAIGAIHKGFASTMGKAFTGIALFVVIMSGVGIGMSLNETTDKHSGITTGQIGRG
ncbi:Uncharacterised protein [Mycobacteroides abscessus subsp. abscessus]|uniref:hypothetical protein n=1 Tax=Mycobacteroides abscessus TaxID=36809 RepID=UPI0009A60571|nr:hypothetical protein [Mycobacteroides abscessus]SLI20022.1 Uncharacterised protein [Mycobacteroides abscessus subsp. abscessus]